MSRPLIINRLKAIIRDRVLVNEAEIDSYFDCNDDLMVTIRGEEINQIITLKLLDQISSCLGTRSVSVHYLVEVPRMDAQSKWEFEAVILVEEIDFEYANKEAV